MQYQHDTTESIKNGAMKFISSPESISISHIKKRLSKDEKSLIESASQVLHEYLELAAKGISVKIIPDEDKEISTEEAASILNVSRPYVIKLIKTKKLPLSRKVGNRRKLKLKDVLQFKEKDYKRREKFLHELTKLDQELGIDF